MRPDTPAIVRALRGNMTQTEFANRLGTTQANISHYESGQRMPNVHTLDAMLKVAGRGWADVFGASDGDALYAAGFRAGLEAAQRALAGVRLPHAMTDEREAPAAWGRARLFATTSREREFGPSGELAHRPDRLDGPIDRITSAFITPDCRANRGDAGAWREAVDRLRAEYDAVLDGWRGIEPAPTLNLVLELERPNDA